MESKRKKPRVLTLTLPSINQPKLVLHGKEYVLRNFSDEGFGVWIHPPLPKDLSKEPKFTAQVALLGKNFDVTLELTHVSGRQHGLRITSDSQELKMALTKLLEPSLYAESLEKKELSSLEDPESGIPRLYYTGNANCEVLVWYHPEHLYLIALQACFLGKWIYRAQHGQKRLGLLVDNFKGSDGKRILNTDLIAVDSNELKGIPEQAAQFLTSAALPLPGHLLWQFFETGEAVFLPQSLFHSTKVA